MTQAASLGNYLRARSFMYNASAMKRAPVRKKLPAKAAARKAKVTGKARARVPALRDVPVDASACWGGLYEMSPDKHAILGPAPGIPNLYLINGSSGHGVMHAPALGHLLAEIVCDGSASTLDVHALRPGRFAEQDLNPVSELL